MLRFRFLFTLLSTFLIANSLSAQTNKDTLVLLNGNVVVCDVIDTTNGVTSIKNPKNEKKNIIIENDRIFSIKNASGESIMYVYDTVIGNEFTIDEMRYFIYGEADADKHFKGNGSLILNTLIGVASGVTGSFLCPIPPFAFAALSGLPKVKIKHSAVSNLEYLKQPAYLMGFERVARKKRKIRSLIGGGIGLGVGLGTFYVLDKNKVF